MHDLADRVAALERRVHRSRALNAALGVALVAVACISARPGSQIAGAVEDVVRARRLEIVNADGAIVVMASSSAEGDGWLSIRSAEERLAFLAKGVPEDAPGELRVYGELAVMNRAGKTLVRAGAGEAGDGRLAVANAAGQTAIDAAARPEGGDLTVWSMHGERAVTLTVDESGRGEVGAWNRAGAGDTLTPGD